MNIYLLDWRQTDRQTKDSCQTKRQTIRISKILLVRWIRDFSFQYTFAKSESDVVVKMMALFALELLLESLPMSTPVFYFHSEGSKR